MTTRYGVNTGRGTGREWKHLKGPQVPGLPQAHQEYLAGTSEDEVRAALDAREAELADAGYRVFDREQGHLAESLGGHPYGWLLYRERQGDEQACTTRQATTVVPVRLLPALLALATLLTEPDLISTQGFI